VHTVVAGYIWLKEGIKITKATFTRAHRDRLWNQYMPMLAKLEHSITSGMWPPKTSGLCGKYCPVLNCSFNGRNVPQQQVAGEQV